MVSVVLKAKLTVRLKFSLRDKLKVKLKLRLSVIHILGLGLVIGFCQGYTSVSLGVLLILGLKLGFHWSFVSLMLV